MFCDLCIRRFGGIWDLDQTMRLQLEVYDDGSTGKHDDNGDSELFQKIDGDLDNSRLNAGNDHNQDIVQISNSNNDRDSDNNEHGDTRSVHSQNSATICSEESDTLIDTDYPFSSVFVHHLDLESLITSAKQDCGICNLLYESFCNSSYRGQPLDGHLTQFFISRSRRRLAYQVVFEMSDTPEPVFLGRYTLIVLETDDPDLNVDLDDRTDSSRTWKSVQSWITECVQSHLNCSNHFGFLPSRLLKLEDDSTFHLVRGEDCAAGAPYATLSYCWGPEPAETKFRLLTSNLNTLEESHRIETLPLTFQHAFTVVKKLGMEYLWIDRLCIMQDSQQDWHHEASQMHLVYKNSSFTISAHGAENDQGGLFYTRDPKKVALSSMTVRLQSSEKYETVVIQEERHQKWAAEFEGGPVMGRGWIMQERLLSPRTIYFGRNQVFWECNSRRCCEGRPNRAETLEDLSLTQLKPELPPIWRQPLLGAMRGRSEDPLLQLFMDWEGVVEEYSSCHLTFLADKLVALSGLANDLRAKLLTFGPGLGTYLAGIWMESLPTGLMWTTTGGASKTYIAPSWSWASTQGKISFGHKWMYQFRGATTTLLAKVLSGKTTPFGDKDTGQVCGGELTVDGHLFTVDIVSAKKFGNDEFKVSLLKLCKSLDTLVIGACFDDNECRWDQLFCLPVQHNYQPANLQLGPDSVEGLLLELLEDNTMRRVGIFMHDVADDWQSKGLLEQYSERKVVTIV